MLLSDLNSPVFARKLNETLSSIVSGAGCVVSAEGHEAAKGGGWTATFDSEFAALRVYHKYTFAAHTSGGQTPLPYTVNMGKRAGVAEWFVIVRPVVKAA